MDKTILLAALPENVREEASSFIDGLNPIAGVDSKEKALEFIGSNQLFNSALDFKVTKSIDAFKVNNQEKQKLEIETIKADVEKQMQEKFNPTMTDSEKTIKLLNDKLDRLSNESVKDKQLIIAKEHTKGKIYDGINLEPYLGNTDIETIDKLDKMLIEPYTSHMTAQQDKLSEVVTGLVNDRLNIRNPQAGDKPNDGQMTRTEFMGKSPVEQMNITEKGVQIID